MAPHDQPIAGRQAWPRLVPPLSDVARPPVTRLEAALGSDHWSAARLEHLALRVGGIGPLATLTEDPVPASDLDPSCHGDGLAELLRSVIEVVDERFGWLMPADDRAVVHGLLGRLAAQPDTLRASAPDRTAAALVWIMLRSSEAGRRSKASFVWGVFGVPSSVPRARALHRALGFDPETLAALPPFALPDASLLTSAERRHIISLRDAYVGQFDEHLRQVEASKPVRRLPSGQIEARTRVLRTVWSAQGNVPGGRRMVLLGVDHVADLDQPPREPGRMGDEVDQVISLTVPDAWTLLRELQRVLSA